MNNLQIIRNFFDLSVDSVSEALNISKEQLVDFEVGKTVPSISLLQKISEFYSNYFNIDQYNNNIEKPIHMRLSIDYLLNIGVTMTDLLAFKWFFENKRSELGKLSINLYNTETRKLESTLSDLHDVFDKFAGYILLNHDGSLNSFIDEKNNNYVSDWRIVLYKNDNLIIDVTTDLIYFKDLINYSIM